MPIISSAKFGEYQIDQYENGTILILFDGQVQPVAKPLLRKIAAEIGVDLLNNSGGVKDTRSLGADVIKMLRARQSV